ncbi:hypothetical protein HELRODRAFT_109597 [Helobdella robusta]|uniref:Glycogen debranching enzyme n=1 Tax=Helobdella robusta TaxID=6412 RepID=T1EEV2_HELRO|nr:hypothetical protein HELRODRAFT_109597 [Helobdella robusta]ESO09331.1 hypothetical protein HELRODRAFT_109597 [Helobdella robusta]
MASQSQLRLLVLRHGDMHEATLYRLERGWKLHFVLDASLTGLPVRLFVNHPLDAKSGPNRYIYRELSWMNESVQKSDNYNSYAEVNMVIAGSYNYYFTINGTLKANGGGYFLVDPILRTGSMDDRLPLDSICCQTVMPKLLGPFLEWASRLMVSKESGYNMIHFTPIQELGKSDSCYCLKDQRKLDPRYSSKDKTFTMDDVKLLVNTMNEEWGVLSLTDLVFNHTANESPWILEHPECAYNLINSPHLKPAYLMDRILWHFSMDVGKGLYESLGVPAKFDSEHYLYNIRRILEDDILPRYKFWEFHQCNIEETIAQFKVAILRDDKPVTDLVLIPNVEYRRLECTVDIPQAIKNYYSNHNISRDIRINVACDNLRHKLQELNSASGYSMMEHVHTAVNNFIANAKYRFIDPAGLRLSLVGPDTPLMWNYFTLPTEEMSVEEEEREMNTERGGAYCMAHNGWVMSDDPLRNFAEPGSNVYLRRELLPWGDSVKLRYGNRMEDCPFLWQYMKNYATETASIFHGVRLDNCHSTPIHVAEYMLDEARKVRPDLYVIAELFTNSEYADNTFINRLGINSLIREGLNGLTARELSRLVHRYGGSPVGSFIQLPARLIMPSVAHALFMDQTHDNESVIQKHTAEDLLSYTAIISMTCSATGSNRGYDEMVPHYIHVVEESRPYKKWLVEGKLNPKTHCNMNSGIVRAKKFFNELHINLDRSGFKEVYVDMITDEVMSITRHNPVSHQSVILYAHTCFRANDRGGSLHNITIPGVVDEIIIEGFLQKDREEEFVKQDDHINGLNNYKLSLSENIQATHSKILKIIDPENTNSNTIHFHNLVPGAIAVLKVLPPEEVRPAFMKTRQILSGFGYQMKTLSSRKVSLTASPLEVILQEMSLNDLNRVLFRSDAEERDDGKGFGAYDIPRFGRLTYCGLQGLSFLLDKIRPSNDLGHPLCDNLRQGDWLMDYIANRLLAHQGTAQLGKWFENTFAALKKVPRYLIPSYFDAVVNGVCTMAVDACWDKMSTFTSDGSKFVRDLSLGSVQMCSYVRSAKLPKLSSSLSKPHPPKHVDFDGSTVEACTTLCAGLPHFSTGLFRNWGRDTFISLRGNLIITGRYVEARFIILGYAGCLRHGLIPNLLGEGISARYNCRDAVWFWLQCIKDFCSLAPNGSSILKDRVMRLYPSDDAPVTVHVDQTLEEVMQEALQRHATGIRFRERHAGNQIDSEMKHEGFNVDAGIDWRTGFVYGGNDFNCGTWMDKMGSSWKAGNKGVPATPRDGSAVELIGLSASVVHWLSSMHANHLYPYPHVVGCSQTHTWSQWYDLIRSYFEKYFWIDPMKTLDPTIHDIQLVNRKSIYKDSLGSSRKYTDYQLRCNFPIAIVVCPDLFEVHHAWQALNMLEKYLVGPLGVKTLDPSDYNYVGDYYNGDDSDDYKRSRGFNYHQGPEWIWPMGYFLRAKLIIAQRLSASKENANILNETMTYVEKVMTSHNVHLQQSPWKSLPELTNSDGKHCADSCEAQAWSVGCLLEVLHEMALIRNQ